MLHRSNAECALCKEWESQGEAARQSRGPPAVGAAPGLGRGQYSALPEGRQRAARTCQGRCAPSVGARVRGGAVRSCPARFPVSPLFGPGRRPGVDGSGRPSSRHVPAAAARSGGQEGIASGVTQTTLSQNQSERLDFAWPPRNRPLLGRFWRPPFKVGFPVHRMRPTNIRRPIITYHVSGTPMFLARSRIALSV